MKSGQKIKKYHLVKFQCILKSFTEILRAGVEPQYPNHSDFDVHVLYKLVNPNY